MLLLDRLAEQRIQEAESRGEFDDLPGAGHPLRIEEDNPFIPAELRTAYRLLKNAGYLPEEVCLLRDIREAEQLLLAAETEVQRQDVAARLRMLLGRMGIQRSVSLATQDDYLRRLNERLNTPRRPPVESGV
jgi:hypothetical protein